MIHVRCVVQPCMVVWPGGDARVIAHRRREAQSALAAVRASILLCHTRLRLHLVSSVQQAADYVSDVTAALTGRWVRRQTFVAV